MTGVGAEHISQIDRAHARAGEAATAPKLARRGQPLQDLSCPRLIVLHLRDERSGRIEFRLRPDPADEENLDRLAIKIAGKIEKKGFEQRLAIIERRAAAATCQAGSAFVP